MTEPTARPWTWTEGDVLRGVDLEMICGSFRDKAERQANRELIVKAVNAYDGLVAALKKIAGTDGPVSRNPQTPDSMSIDVMKWTAVDALDALAAAKQEDKP